jgi:hypothetical protein
LIQITGVEKKHGFPTSRSAKTHEKKNFQKFSWQEYFGKMQHFGNFTFFAVRFATLPEAISRSAKMQK